MILFIQFRRRTWFPRRPLYLQSLHSAYSRHFDPLLIGKTPQMDSYDGTSDPDEHIENIEVVLTYRSVRGAVKCKLFVTTLRRGAMTWFKNLRRNSIGSWGDLCHEFTTHFTVSRTQPKMDLFS